MAINHEKIRQIAIDSVLGYIKNNFDGDRKFQILDNLIPKQRRIRSIVGGLETSLGRTMWEPIAKAIATDNGFSVENKSLKCPEYMPDALSSILTEVINARIKKDGRFDGISSHMEIKKRCEPFAKKPIKSFIKPASGSGVDIWLKKDGINYIFDIKTVQPNLKQYNSFLIQICNWYAYFYSEYPSEKVVARIIFPYNPHKVDFWTKTIGNGKPLEPENEAWVENRFWNFISNQENAFETINEILKGIGREGVLQVELDKIFAEGKYQIK